MFPSKVKLCSHKTWFNLAVISHCWNVASVKGYPRNEKNCSLGDCWKHLGQRWRTSWFVVVPSNARLIRHQRYNHIESHRAAIPAAASKQSLLDYWFNSSGFGGSFGWSKGISRGLCLLRVSLTLILSLGKMFDRSAPLSRIIHLFSSPWSVLLLKM